jgi:NAD(P)-dependent dehydrogenase (short-subunit alcohol dehydrogenase family)
MALSQPAGAVATTEAIAVPTEHVVCLDLAGRTAVVTGGASGIGLACARRLSEAGADVTVLDLNAESAIAVAAEIGGRAIVSDLSDPSALDELSVSADVVVNNAGFQVVSPLQVPARSVRCHATCHGRGAVSADPIFPPADV